MLVLFVDHAFYSYFRFVFKKRFSDDDYFLHFYFDFTVLSPFRRLDSAPVR